MGLPIGAYNFRRESPPFVSYALIIVNCLVFIFLQRFGGNEHFTNAFAIVPQEIISGRDVVGQFPIPDFGNGTSMMSLSVTPIPVYLTFLTAMFLHGSLSHLLGNMLFLWICGDVVEDDLGHMKYLSFYVLCGLLASVSQVLFVTEQPAGYMFVPQLGAGGAIAGVVGGYVFLHPRRRVRIILLKWATEMPAIRVFGFWFVLQLIQGLALIDFNPPQLQQNMAHVATITGFISGCVLVKYFAYTRSGSRTYST